jgi:hypothetical protein
MNQNNPFEIAGCEEDAVIAVDFSKLKNRYKISHPMFTASELTGIIQKIFSDSLSEQEMQALLYNSLDCEVLNPGDQWKKGKLRLKLCLEVSYDETEVEDLRSPLDDLRQKMDEENQP